MWRDWSDYQDWRGERRRSKWSKRMQKLSDEDLQEELQNFEECLRLLGRGQRGLREAQEAIRAFSMRTVGMYHGAVSGRIDVAGGPMVRCG